MKTIKWINQTTVTLAALVLLTSSAGAVDPVFDVSDETAVDTRTMSRVAAEDDKPLDSRSYTIDWSIAVKLNTKKIIGILLLVR